MAVFVDGVHMKYNIYDEAGNVDVEKLKKTMYTKSGKPRCPNCGKAMKMAYDEIAKKKTKYNWMCKCTPGIRLCIL